MNELTFSVTVPDQEISGPLDLLLKFVDKKPENIFLISITDIIDQYFAALQQMEQNQMEITADFLEMASKLILIKSRMMLSWRDRDEEDPREELARQLWDRQQQLEATAFLREQFSSFGGRMQKEPDEIEVDIELISFQDLKHLTRAFQRLLRRNTERERLQGEPVRKINTLLAHRVVPVEERVYAVLRYLFTTGETLFEDLLLISETRSEVIASFAAILELIKVQRIKLRVEESEDPLQESQVYLSLDLTHRRRKKGEAEDAPAISIT